MNFLSNVNRGVTVIKKQSNIISIQHMIIIASFHGGGSRWPNGLRQRFQGQNKVLKVDIPVLLHAAVGMGERLPVRTLAIVV